MFAAALVIVFVFMWINLRQALRNSAVTGLGGTRALSATLFQGNATRAHFGLRKDTPNRRSVEPRGTIVSRDILGGWHHQFCRI